MIEYSNLLNSIEESKTIAITALVKNLQREGKDILSFSAGEPDFPTPEYIKNAAIKAINKNQTKYTAVQGTYELISAIRNKFEKNNNLFFEEDEILVSNGAKHSIYNILFAVCNPGDEVIIQAPYWVSYTEMVKLAGAKPKIIFTNSTNKFKITPEQLEQSITEKTKSFIFNSPSNPTGTVYTKNEIIEIAEVLKNKDVIIISDEIYEKIIFDGEKHFSIGSIDFLKDKTITVNGVSKAYSMTGWRIGYAGGNKKIIRLAKNLQSHSTSNASSISQAAAQSALTEEDNEVAEMVKEFKQRRDFLLEELNKINGISIEPPKGAFYVFFDVQSFFGKSFNNYKIKDSISFCNYLLNEEFVGLVPGIAFGDDNSVRMSYASSLEDLEIGVKRIEKAIGKLS